MEIDDIEKILKKLKLPQKRFTRKEKLTCKKGHALYPLTKYFGKL